MTPWPYGSDIDVVFGGKNINLPWGSRQVGDCWMPWAVVNYQCDLLILFERFYIKLKYPFVKEGALCPTFLLWSISSTSGLKFLATSSIFRFVIHEHWRLMTNSIYCYETTDSHIVVLSTWTLVGLGKKCFVGYTLVEKSEIVGFVIYVPPVCTSKKEYVRLFRTTRRSLQAEVNWFHKKLSTVTERLRKFEIVKKENMCALRVSKMIGKFKTKFK